MNPLFPESCCLGSSIDGERWSGKILLCKTPNRKRKKKDGLLDLQAEALPSHWPPFPITVVLWSIFKYWFYFAASAISWMNRERCEQLLQIWFGPIKEGFRLWSAANRSSVEWPDEKNKRGRQFSSFWMNVERYEIFLEWFILGYFLRA